MPLETVQNFLKQAWKPAAQTGQKFATTCRIFHSGPTESSFEWGLPVDDGRIVPAKHEEKRA
ncbi:MAG: hypothetical protein WCT05_09605 [Lentisphaeria bacterium]